MPYVHYYGWLKPLKLSHGFLHSTPKSWHSSSDYETFCHFFTPDCFCNMALLTAVTQQVFNSVCVGKYCIDLLKHMAWCSRTCSTGLEQAVTILLYLDCHWSMSSHKVSGRKVVCGLALGQICLASSGKLQYFQRQSELGDDCMKDNHLKTNRLLSNTCNQGILEVGLALPYPLQLIVLSLSVFPNGWT